MGDHSLAGGVQAPEVLLAAGGVGEEPFCPALEGWGGVSWDGGLALPGPLLGVVGGAGVVEVASAKPRCLGAGVLGLGGGGRTTPCLLGAVPLLRGRWGGQWRLWTGTIHTISCHLGCTMRVTGYSAVLLSLLAGPPPI